MGVLRKKYAGMKNSFRRLLPLVSFRYRQRNREKIPLQRRVRYQVTLCGIENLESFMKLAENYSQNSVKKTVE